MNEWLREMEIFKPEYGVRLLGSCSQALTLAFIIDQAWLLPTGSIIYQNVLIFKTELLRFLFWPIEI